MNSKITCAGCTHVYADTALFCPNCGRPKVRDVEGDVLLGKLLGERFQVQELLGQGASGTIYRAEHITLRRRVAIKVLHNELSRDDLAVERFRREATTVAEIDNEHIVEIHDFGRTPDGRLYLAMELLEGETLDAVLAKEQTLSVERTADVLIQVGEALMEAHAIGYVHRDLRPRNVYLAVRRGKANFVKLLDFGLAKLVETDSSVASTSLGMTFGDPRYMSPEQARGDRIDRRADIYQLGCVAYEMLTGAPPFSGNRVFDILTKQVTEAPQPLPSRRRDIPIWMEAAVTKMLAKDPDNRFATTTRMVEALRRGLETGEVMDDEVARRRESIPPPSVSRVMAKMGLGQPVDPAPSAPYNGSQTVRGHSPTEPGPALPPGTMPAVAPPMPTPPVAVEAPAMPAPLPPVLPAEVPPVPTAADSSSAAADETRKGMGVSAKADSVELLRKRTGTPRLGVPVPAAPEASQDLAPVAGVIEPRGRTAGDEPAFASSASRKRSAAGEVAKDSQNISQVWFEDDEEGAARGRRRSTQEKRLSASVTDVGLYDELPRRRRWALPVGALAVLVGGGVAVAMMTGGDEPAIQPKTAAAPAPSPTAAPPTPAPEVQPSTIIEPATPGSSAAASLAATPTPPKAPAVAAKAEPKAEKKAEPKADAKIAKADPKPAKAERKPAAASSDRRTTDASLTYTPPPDTGFRRPGGDPGATTILTIPPAPAPTPPPVKAPAGASDAPQDPYGATEPGAEGGPQKQAEFFANLGAQQLGSGDAASAAANFKKALELDPKSAAGTIGMGEIALRQGLFGDAIAHLQKASRLAPRNARVFTLLGEAHLSLGRNAEAAANFKKALQLDPDNTRARDGYNEASNRSQPSSDE